MTKNAITPKQKKVTVWSEAFPISPSPLSAKAIGAATSIVVRAIRKRAVARFTPGNLSHPAA
jgi:hypothetical protein